MSRYLSVPLAASLLLWSLTSVAGPVTTSLQVPLAGTVFVPLDDGSFDMVNLTGRVHVVTQFFADPPPKGIPSDPVRIKFNLDQVKGVGDLTGRRYVATGTNRINFPTVPPDPVSLGFVLRETPPDPVQPGDPVDISFHLTFNPDTGALLDVEILSITIPVP